MTSLTVWILTGFGWAILSIMVHKAQLHVVVVEYPLFNKTFATLATTTLLVTALVVEVALVDIP